MKFVVSPPTTAELPRFSGFTTEAVGSWALAHLAPGTHVPCYGLACFAALTQVGCMHEVPVVGARQPRELPPFQWVNTVLGKLKTSLHGAIHTLAWAKHADTYLAAFAYRFNRRFNLRQFSGPIDRRHRALPGHQDQGFQGWG